MSLLDFYWRQEAHSVAPPFMVLVGVGFLFAIGIVTPIALVIAGSLDFGVGLGVWLVVVGVAGMAYPYRVDIDPQGLKVYRVFGRNREMLLIDNAPWWGRFVPWTRIQKIQLRRNRYPARLQARRGTRHYLILFRRAEPLEIHEGYPAFEQLDRLLRRHVPERIEDWTKPV